MSKEKLTIGFVRRGYSVSGGAESYLKRLGCGVVEAGHETVLFTTRDWPGHEWPFGEIRRVRARSPIGFANELEEMRRTAGVDVLMSLERVCSCDIYRAGDGVHKAWLERRARFERPWEKILRSLNRKHSDILRLEKALLDDRGAERIIANSAMVKNEIVDAYNYRPDRIDVVPNGVPLERYKFDPAIRQKARVDLALAADEIAVLFAGSGWERKGLRYAVAAVDQISSRKLRLLVAGRGNRKKYTGSRTQFLGEIQDLRPIYSAADLFVLPTIYDPFSNAALEALAAGLPVITTKSNGFSEIIEDKIHGSIIGEPDDITALGNAIELWSDQTWRSAARPSILKRASQYDISRNVARTLEIVLQVATAAASTSGNIRNT